MNPERIKPQIIRNEEKLLQAMKNSDLAVLDKLIHEDLQFTIPTGEIITKAIDLESYRSGKMNIDSMLVEERDLQINEGKAIVTVVKELKGSFDGQEINGKFQFRRVWEKFEDQWKIISGSSILI